MAITRYKITFEYDGTKYFGSQKQQDQPLKSVEEVVEVAVAKFSQENVKINFSGRTDAGVHALAQVAHFDLNKNFDPFRVIMALNNYLRDEAVSVNNCQIVDENFHARFSAKMRHYRYVIINRRAPLVLEKNRAWHIAQELNFAEMQKAADLFLGTHDFSAFRDAECQAKSPIRTIEKISLQQIDDKIIFEISAKSFLHHMVRNIVGTLVWVGIDKIKAQEIESILQSCDRTKSGPNAPAYGLYFLRIDY